jgi:cytochrome c5
MRILAILATMIFASGASADESLVRLKDGEGRGVVEANCVMCHSLDYIQMNGPFLDRKGWEGSVGKMIKVMGAPIKEDDVKVIVDYLSSQYGK